MKKYIKIYEDILHDIESGKLRPGDRVLPETELAVQYGVSRKTTRHAISLLFQEGYVYRKTKEGTFVSEKRENATIAVILPREETNNFCLLDSIIDNNSQYGYKIEVLYSKANADTEYRLLRECLVKNIGGIILLPCSDDKNVGIISQILLRDIPIVLVDMNIVGIELPLVLSDNRKGFYDLVDHYIRKGYHKIAFAAIDEHFHSTGRERFRGYCQAHFDNKIPLRSEYIFRSKLFDNEFYYMPASQRAVVHERLARIVYEQYERLADKPEVICFTNDVSAYDFIQYMKKHHPDVLKQIIVTGFDDLEMSARENFSTVRQNFYKIGKKALSIMNALQHKEPLKNYLHVIPVSLTLREGDTNSS